MGVTARDNRLFVEAVLYRFRTGVPWRDLPERFGCGVKVHTRFSRWAKTSVWERVFQHLAADADTQPRKARAESFDQRVETVVSAGTAFGPQT